MKTGPTIYMTKYRCDESMKRSKEKCNTPFHSTWKCTGDCKTCICCIVKDANGFEHHMGKRAWTQKDI